MLLALIGCHAQPNFESIYLSYSEKNTFCIGCPRYTVSIQEGGHVSYECLGDCAVPGEQHHVVPAARFRELVQAFRDTDFFDIPRTDPTRIVADATEIRITWRDQRRIHEVVDVDRRMPRLKTLETRIKSATEVDRYLKPSLSFYQRLVESGWDVNTLGPDHQNALFSAVINQDLDSTRFLLQHGSKVTDQTLDFAAMAGKVELLRLVVEAAHAKLAGELGSSMLSQAARIDKRDSLEYLLAAGADPNAGLFSAVENGSIENARLLLSRSADVNVRDRNGRTALWHAAMQSNTGMIALLVKQGAEVNARDNEGRTPLMHAADLCYTWNIRALLDAGADPTLSDHRGRAALQPNLPSVGDPKCTTAQRMIKDAVDAKR